MTCGIPTATPSPARPAPVSSGLVVPRFWSPSRLNVSVRTTGHFTNSSHEFEYRRARDDRRVYIQTTIGEQLYSGWTWALLGAPCPEPENAAKSTEPRRPPARPLLCHGLGSLSVEVALAAADRSVPCRGVKIDIALCEALEVNI